MNPDYPQTATPHTLAFVGGFLGAGKTTLILKAAAKLRARGTRVAVILNDQDDGLVDTHLALEQSLPTREVAGGCFCCHFTDLIDAADELAHYQPEVIFAEPVGSCVDLSATILQPLRAFHERKYQLAPLTVVVDPVLLERLRQGEMDAHIEFLFRNQIAEADLLCISKHDLYPAPPQTSFPIDFQLSGRTGFGVDAWLHEVLETSRTVGAKLLELDYARYAEAEAALGWLNLHGHLQLSQPLSPSLLVGPLLDHLCQQMSAAQTQIAHLKIFDRVASGWIKAAVTSNDCDPQAEGDLLAEPSRHHQLAINLRALADPALLESLVRNALDTIDGRLHIGHLGAFRPAPPVPQNRFCERVP